MYMQWGESSLWSASFYGHQRSVALLIEAGANVDVPKEVSVTRCTDQVQFTMKHTVIS